MYRSIFLASALVGGEWSALHPWRFSPRLQSPKYPLEGSLNGLQSRSGRYGSIMHRVMPRNWAVLTYRDVFDEKRIQIKKSIFHEFLNLLNSVDQWRMASSGMLRRVALARTNVSEELSASFIRVTRIGELGTTLAATSNRRTLRKNTTDERGARFLRNVGSYKSHTAEHPRRRHSS
jgi:hypothetical protein